MPDVAPVTSPLTNSAKKGTAPNYYYHSMSTVRPGQPLLAGTRVGA